MSWNPLKEKGERENRIHTHLILYPDRCLKSPSIMKIKNENQKIKSSLGLIKITVYDVLQ